MNLKPLLKNSIVLSSSLIISFTGCEVSNDEAESYAFIDLKGSWKFSIGDNPEWADEDYDDSDWEEINVPSLWENEGFYGYDGFAWFRKTLELNISQLDENLFLYLGYIDDVDETYFNGHLIGLSGSFPPNISTAYNAQRKYFIPTSLLKKGTNVISVRVFDIHLDGCGVNLLLDHE